MKLNKEVLKNLGILSKISTSITLNPKTEFIHVRDSTKTIYAKYRISPRELGISHLNEEVGIYDIGSLLSLISLFESPELTFGEDFITITDDTTSSKFYYSELSLISKPKNETNVSTDDFNFIISSESIDKIKKAASNLGLDEVIFTNSEIRLRSQNNSTSNDFEIKHSSEVSGQFNVALSMSEFVLLSGNYGVTINENFIDFCSEDINILIATIATIQE